MPDCDTSLLEMNERRERWIGWYLSEQDRLNGAFAMNDAQGMLVVCTLHATVFGNG